ncbi:MAG: response regulator transcription factor [Chloroflexota bacterium]
MNKISVMLVDDHSIVRNGIKAVLDLQSEIDVVAEAADGLEAISQIQQYAPDVVLMDLIMPNMDGIDATRQIKKLSPTTQVIMLTSFHDDDHIFPAIKAGALSYLLKDVDAKGLITAIKQAAVGEATLHPRIASRVVAELSGRNSEEPNIFAELSEREFEVLEQIANGKSNAEIAETLVISHKTVKRHVSNILSKLHLADRTQAAVMAWRKGVVRK